MKQCPQCGVRFDARSSRCPIDGSPLVAMPDPLIGQIVQERYKIEALLGSGGMASVYRGRHQLIDRQVALKFLKPKHARDETSRARFLREARSVNRVQHEHIIDVSDFGETADGLVYMVMEYLEGRTLTTEIAKAPLPLERACLIGLQVAQALARAHQHGVVHRDVKPANIFLIERGDCDDFVKLLDFGLARGPDDVALTSSNLLFGTPEYMSPEQVRGTAIGAKTDLYALGCVLFEMVAGRIPFEGAPNGVVYMHLYDLPPRPSQLRPDISPELERLILRLLSKSPELRPKSADEVAADLTEIGALIRASRNESCAAASPLDDAEQSLSELRGQLAQRYPNGAPGELDQALRRASRLAQEACELKQNLEGIEEDSEGASGRETQLRIGLAIENLELDAASAAQAIELATGERARANGELQVAATRLMDAWQTFEELSAVQGQAGTLRNHAALMDGLREWATAQRATEELDRRLAAHHTVRADLLAQIAQLKHRLFDLDASLQPTVAKAAELQLQLSAKLAALRSEADRITDQLSRQSPPA